MDGAYIKGHIDEYMGQELGYEGPFMSYVWDLAHLVEIAGKDSRVQKGDIKNIGIDWIRDTFVCARKLTKYYRLPKKWLRIRDLATQELLGVDLKRLDPILDCDTITKLFDDFYSPLALKQFCQTRWSQFTKNVFITIVRNYRLIFLDLENQIQVEVIGSMDLKDRRKLKRLFGIVSNVDFVLW